VKAYDLYLQGRNTLRNGHSQDAYKQALDCSRRRSSKDPNFALAYTGLADSSLRMYGETKKSVWAQKATLAAQQAESAFEQSAGSSLSLGSVYSTTGKNTEAVS
jgi:hypothetical protein